MNRTRGQSGGAIDSDTIQQTYELGVIITAVADLVQVKGR